MEYKIRSLKFNFFMNLILTGSSVLFPLITFPLVSRALGAEAYGLCNWATSIISWFSLFAMLGVNQYGIREVAKHRDNPKSLANITLGLLFFTIISTLISFLCFVIALFSFEALSANRELFIINSISILGNTIGVGWFFQGIEQYKFITIRGIAIKIICFVGIVLLVHTPNDYLIYASLIVLSAVAANIVNLFYMMYIVQKGLPLKFSHLKALLEYVELNIFQNLKKHLRPMLIFFLIAASISVYNLLDTVMLGFLSSYEQVGYYTAAMNITGALTSVISALSGVLMPRATNLLSQKKITEYKRLIKKCTYLVLIVSIFSCTILSIIATPLLSWYAGEDYAPAGAMLSITCLASIPAAISVIFYNSILAPLGLEKRSMIAYLVAAFLNFAANIFLIPSFGGIGASISTLLVETLLALIGFVLVRKYIWGAHFN